MICLRPCADEVGDGRHLGSEEFECEVFESVSVVAAERCGDHGVELCVVYLDTRLTEDHHVEVGVVRGLGDFGVGEEWGDGFEGARAVDLLARTVTDRDVPAFTVGVRE